ncbi:MAG: HDIG domain-containing protein [Clostridia bacterium]|nr:HDIG domain-containing protein [Clostridia bacterium]
MRKQKSQKILPWVTKDVVLNVLVYVLNLLFILFLFVGVIYINSVTNQMQYEEWLNETSNILHFFILLLLIIALMAGYFFFEDRDFLKNPVNSEMIFLIVEISLVICHLSGNYVNLYVRPLALASVLTLFLTDKKKAVFINMIYCLLTFLFDSLGSVEISIGEYPVMLMGFASGIVAVFVLENVYSRIKLLAMSLVLSVPTVVCVGMMLINAPKDTAVIDIISSACSGPFTVCAFIILLPVFETVFTKVSKFKLAELTDHKAKLIRKMISEAPGTFNHAIVVSNIAEACAIAINEDALLARTCAYYHDVGKLRRPEFFKENQADGVNPHDDLTPELSANIIKSHTQDGYNLIMKNRLPKEIADACREHHGTLPILYFYGKAQKFTDGEVDIAQYCYAGPKPRTKIAAIIMIADGCEAAARSLQDRSRENVKQVVRKIVNERMELGQFEDCEITLKELNIIIHTVVNNLTGIYHNRIEYPKVNLDGIDL